MLWRATSQGTIQPVLLKTISLGPVYNVGPVYNIRRTELRTLSGRGATVHGLLCKRYSILGIWLVIPALIWIYTAAPLAQKSTADSPQATDRSGQEAPQPSYLPIQPLPPEKQGDLMMAHGNYAAAIRAYQQAPLTSPLIWDKIGLAYHQLFAYDEARKAYRTALTLDPKYAAALNNLAAIYHGEHEYRLAERFYKRALKYAPNSAVAYLNLGTAYFAESRYKQGMIAYRRALAIDPDVLSSGQPAVVAGLSRQQLVATNYSLARMCAAAGKLPQALNYLRKAFNEGFNDRKQLMEDKEFAALRTTPEFQQLLVEEHLN
jgi:tetratricopeptide (TPR) repeat protein